MIRPPMSLLAAGVVALVGAAGLVRGALPQNAPASNSQVSASAPMVVSGAYVREPANGINAAAYFTVYNTTRDADVLTSVNSGAGAETTLHTETDGSMTSSAAGLTIPAHGSVSLSPGKGHAMIEKLYGPLKPGQTVNLQLSFAKAGEVLATAPVIAIAAAAPTTGAPK